MIYIVRHGETEYNIEGRYGGRIDIPLNDNGKKQAKELKEILKKINFDVVYSSPLQRAYNTARIICDDKNIIIDERLIERNNGDLEGKLKSSIKDNINFNDPFEKKYNIESITDFRKRINDFIKEIIEKYKNKNVLIVTHAGIGIYIRCYFEGEPANKDYLKYKMKNCEILEYEN